MTLERKAEFRALRTRSVWIDNALKECLDEIDRLEISLAHYNNCPPPHPPTDQPEVSSTR